jgi:hypothetical protein
MEPARTPGRSTTLPPPLVLSFSRLQSVVKFLAPHGYHPAALTPGLWTHTPRNIIFSLVVDDFGVRYTSQANADHLLAH